MSASAPLSAASTLALSPPNACQPENAGSASTSSAGAAAAGCAAASAAAGAAAGAASSGGGSSGEAGLGAAGSGLGADFGSSTFFGCFGFCPPPLFFLPPFFFFGIWSKQGRSVCCLGWHEGGVVVGGVVRGAKPDASTR